MIQVPWISYEDIEIEAQKVLVEYGKNIRRIETPPVPVENIIEKLFGLQLELDDVRGRGFGPDALGCLYIKRKKIIIDSSLEYIEGRYHFTCGHELGHWWLHREWFLQWKKQLSMLPEKDEPLVICRESEKRLRREQQADRFAAALLMPKKLVLAVLQEKHVDLNPIFTDETLRYWGITKEEYCRKVASQYNRIFGVSVQAMQIRLDELGLLKQEVNQMLL